MVPLRILLAGLLLSVSAAGANAATYYANNIIEVKAGTCSASATLCGANDRQNVNNAVDEDEATFYSLGFGGEITLGFALPLITGGQSLSAFEITFDRGRRHDEAAEVYSVLNGIETLLGTITNAVGQQTILTSSAFEYIKLRDVTKALFPDTTSYDGFDVSAIKISAVPLPAAGTMLLAGLGGLAALRRLKKLV
jgi:hypothetical protein